MRRHLAALPALVEVSVRRCDLHNPAARKELEELRKLFGCRGDSLEILNLYTT